jgi:hypothetical protein
MTNASLRKVVVPVGLMVLSAAAACGALSSCGGSPTSGPGASDAQPADATMDGVVGADGSGEGAAPIDGTTADSATLDAGASGDSSTADAPGNVQCGTSVCDTNSSYCCRAGLDPSLQTCTGYDAGCSGSLWRCEKPSECPPGSHCIVFGVTAQGGLATTCGNSDTRTICVSSMDCTGARSCVTQTCHFEGGVEVVGICGGSLPSSTCP